MQPPTNRRWVIFAFSCAASFLLYFHRYTWNVIRPLLQEEYGFSNTQLELMGTAFYFTYAIGQIPSGIISDLFGTHLFLVAIIAAWSLTLPLHGFSGRLGSLISVRLLFGAVQAGAYPALGQVTRSWFPPGARTQMQGWVASFFGRGGGAASSFVMATLLMDRCGFSWQIALVCMGVPGLVFAVLLLLMFRSSPEEDSQTNESERELIRGNERVGNESRDVMPFRTAWRNLSLRILVIQQFLSAGADVVYTLTLGSFFVSLGADLGQLGWMVSLPVIGGAMGGVAGGFLNDWLIRRTGSRRWARSGIGFSGKVLATLSLLVAVMLPNAELVAYGLFVVKFFTDWSQPTVWGTCTDLGGKYSATVFSINNTSGNVGALVTPLIVGPLLDWFSVVTMVDGEIHRATNFTPMFALVGAMYIGAAVLWLFVDCTRQIKAPSNFKEKM